MSTSSGIVSVVIPVRDRRALLEDAVESVLEQGEVVNEIIVVDDGSKTPVLEHQLPASVGMRCRVIRIPQRGPSEARNVGIRLATAQYVGFLDSDDVMLAGKLRRQVDEMRRRRVSWSCCGFVNVNMKTSERLDVWMGDLKPAFWEQGCPFGCSSLVVKRKALIRIGGFDSDLSLSEDWDLIIRLSALSEPGVCPEPLYEYRIFCDNISYQRRHEWDSAWASIRTKHPSVISRPNMYYGGAPWWENAEAEHQMASVTREVEMGAAS